MKLRVGQLVWLRSKQHSGHLGKIGGFNYNNEDDSVIVLVSLYKEDRLQGGFWKFSPENVLPYGMQDVL